MNAHKKKADIKFYHFDPRAKMIVLVLCVFAATMAPSLVYEGILVFLIAVFGCFSSRIRYSLAGAAFFALFYCFTFYYLRGEGGMVQTMFVAWMGLFYKVFPCGMLAGIILSTTKVNEFISAMTKAHISKKVVIPLAVMLRYIPTIREDWRYIKDAMRLRDVSPSVKGLLTNPGMTVECVYVPLMMAASKAADELSIASVTRGIENPNPRTCLVQIRLRFGDALVILCFSVLFIVGRFL